MDLGLADHSYSLWSSPSLNDLIPTLRNDEHLVGFNVTIPFKKDILQYSDQIDAEAAAIGAANTIQVKREGGKCIWKAYNTDVYGFEQSIKPFLHQSHHRALVLGKGGAAAAVCHVLKKLGVEVTVVTRQPNAARELSWTELNEYVIRAHYLIINTTPLGMFPHLEECPPLPYEYLTPSHFLMDLIYNPAETLFLKKGKERGTEILNGLSMLHHQAEKAWQIWQAL